MKRIPTALMALTALSLAAGVDAFAQVPDSNESGAVVAPRSGLPQSVQADPETPWLFPLTSGDVDSAKAAMEALRKRSETLQQMIKVGAATAGDLPDIEAALAEAQNRYNKTLSGFADSKRLSKLSTPIDVQLKDATITQTAKALSAVSGVPIHVDPGVSSKIRITLEAKHMPLYTVLTAVSKQADLVISPYGDSVSLDARPSLTVNGKPQPEALSHLPWSSKWKTLPPMFLEMGGGLWDGNQGTFNLKSILPSTTTTRIPDIFTQTEDRVAVTSIGDRVVLAEPGVNDNGDRGTWLVIYKLDGDSLVEAGSTFHPEHKASVTKIKSLTLTAPKS